MGKDGYLRAKASGEYRARYQQRYSGRSMMRLNKAGFSIVFHVHDEAVLEVPEGKSSVEEVCRIMAEPPSWVHGLPLRADATSANL